MTTEPKTHPPFSGSGKLAAVMLGIGLLAPALQVGLDPHLRPVALSAWLSGVPAALGAFAGGGLASLAIAWIFGSGASAARQLVYRLISTSGATIGLALWAIASPRVQMSWVPRQAGLVFSSADLALLGVLSAIQLGLYGLCVARGGLWLHETPVRPFLRFGGGTVALAVSVALALGLAGTRIDAPDVTKPLASRNQVALIGVDGMDWEQLSEQIERGLTPNLAALVEGGASGSLSTFRPTLSPIIWTTVATGQPPERHGIFDFLEATTRTPYTSNSRRVPALWNLLSDRGASVGVVGWWVTWPAEVVNGAIVSSYSTPDVGTIKGSLHAGLDGQVYPPELMAELEGFIASDIAAGGEEMRSILKGYRPALSDPFWDKRVRTGSWVLAADRMFARAAVEVAQRFDPQLLAVYFSSTDTTAHAFCLRNHSRHEICGRVVDGAYAAVDRAIGQVLAAARPDASVIVVSDHGFDLRIGHEHGLLHGPPGVAIAKGPGIRAGASIDAATVYDIAPTVLALMGAPLPIDQRGRPWLGMLSAEYVAKLPLESGAAMVPQTPRDEDALRPRPAQSDDAMRERLRALGYIE